MRSYSSHALHALCCSNAGGPCHAQRVRRDAGGGQAQRQPVQQAAATQHKVVKQVVTTTTTTPVAPAAPAHNTYPKVEGFTDGSSMMAMGNDKNWIVLGLVIFSAMALNECCKYFLNKSLQLNDGSPMYYVAYVVVAILLSMAANKYASS